MMRAAGIILMSPQGRVLMLQRSPSSDHGSEWCFPGGGIEDGETAATAAIRECLEETGYAVETAGDELCTRVADDVHFTTFVRKVDDEFVPRLNDEHVAWAWVRPEDALAAVLTPAQAAPPAAI